MTHGEQSTVCSSGGVHNCYGCGLVQEGISLGTAELLQENSTVEFAHTLENKAKELYPAYIAPGIRHNGEAFKKKSQRSKL